MALLQISEPGQTTAPHQHRLAVGIDLGTTNSLVATVRSSDAQTLADENGQHILPSVVRYAEEGVEVGEVAIEHAVSDPSNTIVSFQVPNQPCQKFRRAQAMLVRLKFPPKFLKR